MSDKINPDRSAGRTLPALALTRAGGNTKPAPASVYLLADHLDTVLAAAEDIVNARLTWNSARRAGQLKIAHEKHSFRDDIEEIRKLENTIVIRVLTSRERAEDVARDDKRFRQLAKLYVAGTAVLLDAVQECGDSTDSDFATADAIPAYLRSRGLIDPDAPAPDIGENLQVGENFMIAKRIAVGPLMDLAAALLDALELNYDLFLDENELAMAPQINRFEDEVAASTHEPPEARQKDPDLQAAIENIREDVNQHADTSTQPDVWSKMSTAGAVLAPVISPPASEPLVHVSTTEAADDTAPYSASEEIPEDDVVTEIVIGATATDDIETTDTNVEDIGLHEAGVEDGGVNAPDIDIEAAEATDDVAGHDVIDDSDVKAEIEASDENALAAEDSSSDDSDLSADLDENASSEDSDADLDDSLIITAANDDVTGDSSDTLNVSDDADSDDGEIALIADNMDSEADAAMDTDEVVTIEAANSDVDEQDADDADLIADDDSFEGVSNTASDTDPADDDVEAGSAEDDVEASVEASADNDTSVSDKEKSKKSKSLVGRLSLIKS